MLLLRIISQNEKNMIYEEFSTRDVKIRIPVIEKMSDVKTLVDSDYYRCREKHIGWGG